MNFGGLGHKIADRVREAVGSMSSVPKESTFASSGKITPDEFVAAGDLLVFKFPTWQWVGSADETRKAYLPQGKQYLITRGIQCKNRLGELDCMLTTSKRLAGSLEGPSGEGQEGDDWFVAGSSQSRAIPAQEKPKASSPKAEHSEKGGQSEKSGHPAPAVKLDDRLKALDVKMGGANKSGKNEESIETHGSGDGRQTKKTPVLVAADTHTSRLYDVSITWDRYYQTPRLWLVGYDADGKRLTGEQILQDIHTDYSSKTVTIEQHPFAKVPSASIHPCRHAEMMKKLIDETRQADSSAPLRSDMALVVFLKFMSSVIPGINYDFTADVAF